LPRSTRHIDRKTLTHTKGKKEEEEEASLWFFCMVFLKKMFDDEIGTLIFECRGCKDICFAVDDNTSTIINTSTCLQCRIEQKLPNKRMRLDPTPLVQPLEPLLLLPPAAHLLKSRSEPEDADKIASNQFIFPFRKNLSQLGPADFVGRFCHYYPSVIGDESVLNYLADCGRLWRVTPECIKIKSRSYNVGVSFFSCASKMPYVIKAEIIPNRGWCDEIQTAASYASKLFEAERIDRSEFDSALVFHYRQRKNGSPWLKILEAKRSMVVMLCI
jgi:hypothetical protein